MPPRNPGLTGPQPARVEDIAAINTLFSEVFTDRYQRDGLTGVRVPLLNPAIWRYAIEGAGEGAMLWRDAAGAVAGFNIVHRSGAEGWMGPLAVRPDFQERGVGGAMVRAGIAWLRHRGARVIGLETMPRTVENIGFYSRLGFRPGHLTVTVTRRTDGVPPGQHDDRLGAMDTRRESALAACRALTNRLAPGVDFTREIALTAALDLGDTSLVFAGRRLRGFVLWHAAPLAAGRAAEEIRVLKLVAEDAETLLELLNRVAAEAAARQLERITLRAQTAFGDAFAALIQAGFRVQWTDLRMTLTGAGEQPVAGGSVVFSNWEI